MTIVKRILLLRLISIGLDIIIFVIYCQNFFVGEFLGKRGDHEHAPDAAGLESKKVIERIKKASDSNQTTRNIISEAFSQSSMPIAARLPSTVALSRTIQRSRNRNNVPPPNPVTVDSLVIPSEYTLTLSNLPFLLYDSKNNENWDINNRILIFTTNENLNILNDSEIWFADGTFKSVPNIFNQLYTIHGNIDCTVYPLIYILMCSKNENSYSEVLNQINILKPNLQPNAIVIDFEQAFIKSFKELYTDVKIHGCFFHFTQCLWRKLQSCGLKNRYSTDAIFSHEIKKLSALAFVPVDNVIFAFEELINSDYYVDNEEELRTVVDYFEDTWIGRPTRGGRRRTPTFPIKIWNMFDAVMEGSPRTNNSVEGWHRAFNSALAANHVTVWKFINMLKREQGLQEAKMEQQTAGAPQQKKKAKI
ncbi:uncharacterized protein LOC111026661 [Myzus persicae]|uniref:uncharacterized protein LOC111026661 n=1 Tax=Myzus persicae TaxID=13164 RepID=UPI000B92F8AF|nr:uncharacterized protein LOC111026661 [Myzus persicae]